MPFGRLAVGDVEKRDHGADKLACFAHGIGPVFDRETGPVRAPQHLLGHVAGGTVADGSEDCTFLHRIWAAIRTRVVDRPVHILSEQIFGLVKAQEVQAGGIAEGTIPIHV
jgi:hypothetical protein